MTKSVKTIGRVVESHRKWLQRTALKLEERERAAFEKALSVDALHAFMLIASTLDGLGTVHATRGLVGLFDGREGAWLDIERSWLYRSWEARLRIKVAAQSAFLGQFRGVGTGLSQSAHNAVLVLAYDLAFASGRRTVWMVQPLTDVLRGDPRDRPDREHLERFVLAIEGFAQGRAAPVAEVDEMGVYGEVVRSWSDPKRLRDALLAACEYHCENMVDTGDEDFTPEFRDPPFDLVPAEILAVIRVRERLGLETPAVDHPLLALDFFRHAAAAAEVRIEDDLIARVSDKYDQFFGGNR